MIKFFRKIRQRLLKESRFKHYMVYAIGEIVLVVIGILIALAISNWNEERIQEDELQGILESIANGVQSDIKELNLLSTARSNIVVKSDSIFNQHILSDRISLDLDEAFYITQAFNEVFATVALNVNSSTYDALNNSIYIGKIQGTDLSALISAYFAAAKKISSIEDRYNQALEKGRQDWQAKFRNRGEDIFIQPWELDSFPTIAPRYLEILRDESTVEVFQSGSGEGGILQLYREQILMGKKLIEMIRESKTQFDRQTKLDFSGILFSFADADFLSILSDGQIPSGFNILYAASGNLGNYISTNKDYLSLDYPANTYEWASPYFLVNALSGRVHEMDFSTYSTVVVELRGEVGGESVEIMMKDKDDPRDGTESRVKLELTKDWKTYEIVTSQFNNANMQTIEIPLGFVFEGPVGRKIHVRTIQFKKN